MMIFRRISGRHFGMRAVLGTTIACASYGCTQAASSVTAGALSVAVTGLPAGTNASVTVIGPNGLRSDVVASTTLTGLAAGTCTIQASTVIVGADAYEPSIKSQQVSISGGATVSFAEQYTVVAATLQVLITGLPADVLYLAPPPTLTVTVTPGVHVVARIQYSHPESSLTVTVDGVYITQGAQGYDGSVPLIADRPGLLRVFLKGSEANTAVPDVRVRLYAGALVTNTYTIRAPTLAVPTTIVEADGTKSWNLALPEHLLQPGQRLLIDVDPAALVPLATRANLSYPNSGAPQVLNVVGNVAYNLTFVPIVISTDGTTGDITTGGIPDFTNSVKLLHPVWNITASVHAPFTFTGGALGL